MSYLNLCKPGQNVKIKLLRAENNQVNKIVRKVKLSRRSITDINGARQEAAMPSAVAWGITVKPITHWRKMKMKLPILQTGVLVYNVEHGSTADKNNAFRRRSVKAGSRHHTLRSASCRSLRMIPLRSRKPNSRPRHSVGTVRVDSTRTPQTQPSV